MNQNTKQKVQYLLDKYFIGQNNDELIITSNDLNKFLQEYNTVIISRTIEVYGLH